MGRAVACAVTAAILTGCTGASTDEAQPDDGPLRLQGNEGVAMGAWAPVGRRDRWTLTFGSLLPCSSDGSEITITAVDYDFGVEPTAARPWIRDLPPPGGAKVRQEVPRALNRAPFISEVGSPPFERYSGTFTDQLDQRVTRRCDAPVESQGGLDLLTELTVDRRGGVIEAVDVDYRADGEDYSLRFETTMGICGTELVGTRGCGSG